MKARRPALALAFLVLLAACGSTATLQKHAYAAQVLEDVSVTAKALVLDLDKSTLQKAAIGVSDPDERTRLVKEAQVAFEARGLIASVNLLIDAKDAYVRAVLLAAQNDSPSWAELKPAIKSALDAYSALRLALGVDGSRLPSVPSVVAGMVL